MSSDITLPDYIVPERTEFKAEPGLDLEPFVIDEYKKRTDYEIGWRKASPGEHVYNYLENADYETTDEKCIVLTGTQGEQWVVSEDKLRSTYNIGDRDLAVGDMGRSAPLEDAETVFARRAKGCEQITTSWGTVLTANREGVKHGEGDMVVYASDEDGMPDFGRAWIVNGVVWENTYSRVEESFGYSHDPIYDLFESSGIDSKDVIGSQEHERIPESLESFGMIDPIDLSQIEQTEHSVGDVWVKDVSSGGIEIMGVSEKDIHRALDTRFPGESLALDNYVDVHIGDGTLSIRGIEDRDVRGRWPNDGNRTIYLSNTHEYDVTATTMGIGFEGFGSNWNVVSRYGSDMVTAMRPMNGAEIRELVELGIDAYVAKEKEQMSEDATSRRYVLVEGINPENIEIGFESARVELPYQFDDGTRAYAYMSDSNIMDDRIRDNKKTLSIDVDGEYMLDLVDVDGSVDTVMFSGHELSELAKGSGVARALLGLQDNQHVDSRTEAQPDASDMKTVADMKEEILRRADIQNADLKGLDGTSNQYTD